MLHRIQRRDTFDRLRNPLGTSRHGLLGAKWVDSRPDEPSPAFGFAIPRSYGSAVLRNRVRRQLRHLLAEISTDHLVRHGQYLITVRAPRRNRSAGVNPPNHVSLRRDLYRVLGDLGALADLSPTTGTSTAEPSMAGVRL